VETNEKDSLGIENSKVLPILTNEREKGNTFSGSSFPIPEHRALDALGWKNFSYRPPKGGESEFPDAGSERTTKFGKGGLELSQKKRGHILSENPNSQVKVGIHGKILRFRGASLLGI